MADGTEQSGDRQLVGPGGFFGRSGFGAAGTDAEQLDDFFAHFAQQGGSAGAEVRWVHDSTATTLHTGVCAGSRVRIRSSFTAPLTATPAAGTLGV
jgi:hypothetical protein